MVQAVPAASSRGPAPRLRCLACREPLGAADDVTRVGGPRQVPAAPVDRGWYALVADEVCGPLRRDQIARMHAEGRLDDQGLVWHEGFRGWARLVDTTTFIGLFGGRRGAPRWERDEVVDLTDDVDLVEVVPASARRSPPPLRRTITEPAPARTCSPRRATPPPRASRRWRASGKAGWAPGSSSCS